MEKKKKEGGTNWIVSSEVWQPFRRKRLHELTNTPQFSKEEMVRNTQSKKRKKE